MLKKIDAFLDGITMYKLLRYYLAGLLLVALALSLAGVLPFSPLALTVSTLLALGTCWIINYVFARIFNAPTSTDSSLITGFILALIITPAFNAFMILFMLAACGLAMASKYILTIRRRHIFNPAAVAVLLTSLGPKQAASWWVGTAVMLPFVIVGGVLIIRKIRRSAMAASFLASTTICTALFAWLGHMSVLVSLQNMALSSAVFFMAFVMLTEPATSPTTRKNQMWYGALVGAILPPQVHIFGFYSSPEIALIIGNIFSYITSPRAKLFPVLKEKVEVAANIVDFVFYPEQKFTYRAGQYMEFTLPHSGSDSRGDRRYFTLASSPTETEIRIGVKFQGTGSSFKKALLGMDRRTPMVADHVSGDFTLPKDTSQKLAFIAGGIGVTPFRSMAKYMADQQEKRSVVMLHAARTWDEVAYAPVFDEAKRAFGMRTIYVLSDEKAAATRPGTYTGTTITPSIIAAEIPDYAKRVFYISGTHQMVEDMKHMLLRLGVRHAHIKTDFFPGYA